MSAPRVDGGIAFVSVLVLTACIFVFGASERRIAEETAANDLAAAALRADEAALAARAGVDARAARLRELLAATERTSRRTSPASTFLSDAVRAAAKRRTTITLLAADAPRTATPASTVPFTLGLEGRYADVLATIRSFSTLRIPASLALTALTRSNVTAGERTIAATLRVELQPPLARDVDAGSR